MFLLIARYFWAVLLVVSAINAVVLRRRFRAYAAEHPEREAGYRLALRWFVAVNLLLWGWMGLGIVVGGVPQVFAYLIPLAGGPYVLVWHMLYVALWFLALVWVLFLDGAEFLVAHPGLLRTKVSNPRLIKIMLGLMSVGVLLVELVLWSLDGLALLS